MERRNALALELENLTWAVEVGLAEGDLLERVNGDTIDSMDRWQELLRAAETDQEISVVVRRDGQRRRFDTKTVPPRGSRKPT